MRAAAAILATVGACALAGCATSDRDQVKAKVEQLASAAAGHDYKMICEQVLAPALVTRLADAGVTCEQAMQIAFGRVQDPTLSIGRLNIAGASAEAITLSGAKGQQASLDAIELIKTANGWRVSSLGAPVAQKSGK